MAKISSSDKTSNSFPSVYKLHKNIPESKFTSLDNKMEYFL